MARDRTVSMFTVAGDHDDGHLRVLPPGSRRGAAGRSILEPCSQIRGDETAAGARLWRPARLVGVRCAWRPRSPRPRGCPDEDCGCRISVDRRQGCRMPSSVSTWRGAAGPGGGRTHRPSPKAASADLPVRRAPRPPSSETSPLRPPRRGEQAARHAPGRLSPTADASRSSMPPPCSSAILRHEWQGRAPSHSPRVVNVGLEEALAARTAEADAVVDDVRHGLARLVAVEGAP